MEAVRSYWMEQARRAEEQKENPGTFVNYVLLKEANWDKEALLRNLKETWGIEDEPDNGEDEDGEDTDTDEVFVISYQGAMIAVSFMPAPIPDGEAGLSKLLLTMISPLKIRSILKEEEELLEQFLFIKY